MAGRNRKRAAVGALGLAVVVAAGWITLAARAQIPAEPTEKLPGLVLPGDPTTIEDPNVVPAQLTRPPGPPTGTPTAFPGGGAIAPLSRAIADPPAPTVRIQVRVPADAPPGDDIRYMIVVSNASQADAHAVAVRVPLPDGAAAAVKAEPKWDDKQSDPAKQVVWALGTIKAGQSRTIELFLRPKPDAREVKALAYVKFEHGQAVTTRINRPTLKVTKTAPRQVVRDEPYLVRVLVENTGRVVAEEIRVVENVDRAAEVEAVTAGSQRTRPDDNQWQWTIPRLAPGERKLIEYRVTPRQASDSLTTSNVSATKGVLEKADTRTQVLVPGLAVKLTGPTGPLEPGTAAMYEITVRNTGTLPSTNVRVTGTIPSDCKATRKTEGGQLYRDTIVWTVPRLEPGEAHAFRYWLKANTSGRRVVRASAIDARDMRSAEELATLFQGSAVLVWETVPEPAALAVGRRGTFTVRVKNNGGEVARNVRVDVELPPAVNLIQTTPSLPAAGKVLVFGPESVPAYGEAVYTITYEARESAQAWFRLKMTADALGDRPMTTEKAVEITGGR